MAEEDSYTGADALNSTLRSIPQSEHYFWDQSQPRQLHQPVTDKLGGGSHRKLPENESAVMALNELAVQRGRGFFFHFRNRDSSKKGGGRANGAAATGELCPASRATPSQLAPDFPSIAYMNFIWDDTSRVRFFATSHRSRYLKCDGQLNLPNDATPIYAIQYAASRLYPLYATPTDSMVVLATPTTLYLASISDFDRLVGRWSAKRPPACGNPDSRFSTTPFIWDGAKDQGQTELQHTMRQSFEVHDFGTLYEEIVQRCTPAVMAATFTARELKSSIPRPENPEPGMALGTPLQILGGNDDSEESSNAKSRRGGTLQRGRKASVRESDRKRQKTDKGTEVH